MIYKLIFFYLVGMASGGWSPKDLENTIALVREKGASFRAASEAYGIPKSTLHDHFTGKAKRVVHPILLLLKNKRL